jgi:hypothetical protein
VALKRERGESSNFEQRGALVALAPRALDSNDEAEEDVIKVWPERSGDFTGREAGDAFTPDWRRALERRPLCKVGPPPSRGEGFELGIRGSADGDWERLLPVLEFDRTEEERTDVDRRNTSR